MIIYLKFKFIAIVPIDISFSVIDLMIAPFIILWIFLQEHHKVIQAIGSVLGPIAIACSAIFIQRWLNMQNKAQFQIEQDNILRREELQRGFTEMIAKRDHDLSVENKKKTTFEAYFNRIIPILENKELDSESISFTIIRALTISTLREMDAERNKQLTMFLSEVSYFHFKDSGGASEASILRRVDLENIQFNEAYLNNADLSGSNLKKGDFSYANLAGADLSNTNLEDADFSYANLEGANFFNAKLTGAKFIGATLKRTIFVGAKMRAVKFFNAKIFENTSFADVDLSWSDFYQAEISNSCLKGCRLNGVKFVNTVIRNVDFSDTFIKRSDFSLTEMERVDFTNAYLRLLSFNTAVDVSKYEGTFKMKKGFSAPVDGNGVEFVVNGKARLKALCLKNASLYSVNSLGAVLINTNLAEVKINKREAVLAWSSDRDF